jgi:hypothetical protein
MGSRVLVCAGMECHKVIKTFVPKCMHTCRLISPQTQYENRDTTKTISIFGMNVL